GRGTGVRDGQHDRRHGELPVGRLHVVRRREAVRRAGLRLGSRRLCDLCRGEVGGARIASMEAKVREGHAPAVVVALEPGEKLTSEAGAMMFISGEVTMDVEMPGGVTGGLKRAFLSGESMFLATYTARGAGAVGLCGPFPGSHW